MTVNNNAKIIRRELLARISSILIQEEPLWKIDRIALEMRPRKGEHARCCIYHDRAVLKYKIMAMLGFEEEEGEDELKSLSVYFQEALQGLSSSAPLLSVADEACSSCQKNNYVVTNMCQGCVGRSCQLNCPKGAIDISDGKAKINKNLCVDCGICQKVCPFHAIIYAPVPCEDVCPVGAIQKDEDGKEKIDMDKCILCGKCMEACPYGAVVEKSHLFDVIGEVKGPRKVIAMVAPSIAGQFRDSMGKILFSMHKLGFDEAREVASGADETAIREAKEFLEHAQNGQSMTTSCCPAYVNMVNKHSPELMDKVSTTLSPMEYTALALRKEYPDAALVFIGPCVAKKGEAIESPNVDYVLNFEEFGAWLIATETELSECEECDLESHISAPARYFAQAGGVSEAVAVHLHGIDFETVQFDGIDKGFLKKLKTALNGKSSVLVEVMSCENGCVGGCSSLANPKAAVRQLKKFVESEVIAVHAG
jgi:[FeFe] hydrogenase (group B1/B3)